VSPIDFSRSGELIERSLESTRHWLPTTRPEVGKAELLEPHRDCG